MAEQKQIDKLTSIDEVGNRINIIPAEVRGYFKKHRSRLHFVFLIIFLGIPWIHISGHQIILINIPGREFNFFGILLRAHDAPLIFLLLAISVFGLAFVTAIWGRIWCGWACPQTVFIEAVYRKIEQWTEGDYIERRRLQNVEFSWNKFKKRTFKWLLFVAVSLIIAHSFIAYFVGSKSLLKMMTSSPFENWTYFILLMSFTAGILFNFAWFREQFCVIMCPYGRIQSVLLEPSSLTISYDESRGEPRRGKETTLNKIGDCVSCRRCVEVCPTGIDIRNGLQLECIACTACIDACDEIMAKVKKPAGLIAYRTINGKPMRFLKWKTIFYGVLILISMSVLIYNLGAREPLNIAILRAIEAPYRTVYGDSMESAILNHFKLHLTNQTHQDSKYTIRLSELDLGRGFKLTKAQEFILLKADGSESTHLFIQIPTEKLDRSGQMPLKVVIQNSENQVFERELIFLGPKR